MFNFEKTNLWRVSFGNSEFRADEDAIGALGQDSLLCFGDAVMKEALSKLSGLEFQWE